MLVNHDIRVRKQNHRLVKNLFHGCNYIKRHPAIHRSQHEITMSRVLCLCAYCKLIEVNIHLDYKYGMSVLAFHVTSEVFTLCLGVFHEMSGL